MKRKFLLVIAIFVAIGLVAWAGIALSSKTELPPGVSTNTPSIPSVTQTTRPPTKTVTVTVVPPVTSTTATVVKPPSLPQACEQDGVSTSGWNTEPDDSGSIYPIAIGPLAPPSVSTGECFDKLVFTVQTFSGVEFSARYVPEVTADGSGLPVADIKGSKFIQLTIRANMLYDDQGNPQYNAADYNIPDVQGYGNLRELRLVTANFEGYATFGIGVDTMTPFAVEAHAVDGEYTNVVVYITRPHR